LLVDDNATVRTVSKVLLEEHADLQVVGEASDGEEAVVLAERYRPDVTLMDIRLPRVSGVEATRQINKKLPQSMIIGMSSPYGVETVVVEKPTQSQVAHWVTRLAQESVESIP